MHRAQLDLGPFRLSRLLQHGGYPSRTTRRRAHRSGHLPAGPRRTESFVRRAVPRTRAQYREPHNRFVPARPPRPKAAPSDAPPLARRAPTPRPFGMSESQKIKRWDDDERHAPGVAAAVSLLSLRPLGRMGSAPAGGRLDRGGGPPRAAPLGQPCERVSQGRRSAFTSLGSGGFGHFLALFWERQGAAGRGRFRLNAVARCHGAESLCTACTACHHILYVRSIVHNGNVLLCTRPACLAPRVFLFSGAWRGW